MYIFTNHALSSLSIRQRLPVDFPDRLHPTSQKADFFLRQNPNFFTKQKFLFYPTCWGLFCWLLQIIRQIVDFRFYPCYPVSQIRSLHLHKACIRFYLPPRSHTEPFCRHSSTTKSFGPCEADFYFSKRLAAA